MEAAMPIKGLDFLANIPKPDLRTFTERVTAAREMIARGETPERVTLLCRLTQYVYSLIAMPDKVLRKIIDDEAAGQRQEQWEVWRRRRERWRGEVAAVATKYHHRWTDREEHPERFGQPCRLVSEGRHVCEVHFEDGTQIFCRRENVERVIADDAPAEPEPQPPRGPGRPKKAIKTP